MRRCLYHRRGLTLSDWHQRWLRIVEVASTPNLHEVIMGVIHICNRKELEIRVGCFVWVPLHEVAIVDEEVHVSDCEGAEQNVKTKT